MAKLYDFMAARDGDVIRASFLADDEQVAQHTALEMAGDAFREKSWKTYEDMAGDTDGCTLELATHEALPVAAVAAYRKLARGLNDMLARGLLGPDQLPEDDQWLASVLAELDSADEEELH
jgi:hypothetical protein